MSDAHGHFTFPPLLLAYNNASAVYEVTFQGDSYFRARLVVGPRIRRSQFCAAATTSPSPSSGPRIDNIGALHGTILDQETGQPIVGATIDIVPSCLSFGCGLQSLTDTTDDQGVYDFPSVLVGFGFQTSTDYIVEVNGGVSDYYTSWIRAIPGPAHAAGHAFRREHNHGARYPFAPASARFGWRHIARRRDPPADHRASGADDPRSDLPRRLADGWDVRVHLAGAPVPGRRAFRHRRGQSFLESGRVLAGIR